MERIRAQAIVHRGSKILMVKHSQDDRSHWCLPGGGVEVGETPEEAAIRELAEECGVEGEIVRQLSSYTDIGGCRSVTFLVDIDDQEIEIGSDPEFPLDAQILVDVQWLSLEELSERDRAFLWGAGLLSVDGYVDTVISWGDDVSYPGLE